MQSNEPTWHSAIDWHPTSRHIRQFGVCTMVLLPLLGWWMGANQVTLYTMTGFAILYAILAWITPAIARPVYLLAIVIAWPLGKVVGEFILILIYFLIFLPIGLAFRISGRDALKLRIDRRTDSYWEVVDSPTHSDSYYRRY